MNWVEYLEDNYHIQYPTTSDKLVKAFDMVALTIQYREGWDNYTVTCTKKNLHFGYTKNGKGYYVIYQSAKSGKTLSREDFNE